MIAKRPGASLAVLFLCLGALPALGQVEAGGGWVDLSHADDPLTPGQRAAIQAQIETSRAGLRAEGLLPEASPQGAVAPPSLEWPLEPVPSFDAPGYHGVSGFVDHDPAFPDALQDYMCGTRSYDTAAGYNHSGVDYFLWPFTWNTMDDETIQIVAAAPGTIVWKHDGEFDRSCSLDGSLWNAVYVEHADGSVAWYGHMKNGSVTSKPVGQTVATGEVLGLVGSSGNSTGPHLHFELQDQFGNVLDPYAGACNPVPSLWASQPPDVDSAINRITTGFAPPVLSACEGPEIPNEQTAFQPGTDVYVSVWYRDQRASQTSTHTLYRPDDSVFSTWDHTPPPGESPVSFWYFVVSLPTAAPNGTWRLTVDYQGTQTEQTFEVQGPPQLPLLTVPAGWALAAGLLATGLLGLRKAS